jgi:hypothetical protein
MAKLPAKDVVVLLPGILGSVLQRDGKDAWAMSKGALLRGLFSLGGSVKDLALDGDDPEQDDLGDGVTAPRLMPDLHLVPGLWKIDGYTKVRERLLDTFDFTEGKNWFDFPYDWRRDNRVAARHLAEQAPQWLKAWRCSAIRWAAWWRGRTSSCSTGGRTPAPSSRSAPPTAGP